MQNKLKFILDVGSSSLRLLAVAKFMGKPRILTEESVLYDGFLGGEFLSPDKLSEELSQIIGRMSDKFRKSISSIVVGVPSEFCMCVCKRISRKFLKPHKILDSDLLELYQNNANFGDSEDYVVVNFSPMQCVLDDGYKTLSPVGEKTTSIVLDASYILAKKSFLDLITQSLEKIGIKNVEYISTSLGQAMCCEPQKKDGRPFAIVDCGHITTEVSVYKGEGLALMSSFSVGGGHISSDLMQLLGLSFKSSELLKRKVVLTVESNKNENYEVCSKGALIKAPINMTNQVVKSRIEMISKVINNILSIDDVFKGIDIYLTGDGLANFKGVKNIMQDITGCKVYDFKVPFDNSVAKYQTSKIGLVTLADVII